LLGRVEYGNGTAFFVPAARIRRGRRPLVIGRAAPPEAGDYVVADCPLDDSRAHLIEVLGREDDPRWDDLAVLSRHRWPTRFAEDVLAEAQAAPPPERAARSNREDFRDRICFTMDPVDAADFDDALSWRDLGGGQFEVGIHIADVSYYVRPGSALDAAARERATSVYLAGRAVPMLPDRLSSNLCSLVPDRDRFVLSVIAEMDGHGGVHRYRIAEGKIRSRARLHYEQGAAVLAGTGAVAPEVERALRELAGIAAALHARRVQRGAIDLDTQEVKAVVAPDGRTLSLERKQRLETHRIVEEFMLLANTLVGEEAERRGEAFLFRVHEPPPAGKLVMLARQLRALGLPHVTGDDPGGRVLQRLLAVSLPPEKRRLVAQLVLRAMSRAGYREMDAGHFGLATRAYCHFTSPIRRYPDLFNHRQVRHWLHEPRGRGRLAWQRQIDDERRALEELFRDGVGGLARHTTEQEWTAQEAERESVRVKALRFMESFLGEEYDGTIVGVIERGVFVELDAHPVEGFCRVSDAVDDDFRLDEAGVRLVGRRSRRRFGLGDRVRVALARIDVPARELELSLVVPRPRPAGGRRARAQRRSGGVHR
jgi:ribonuclease R